MSEYPRACVEAEEELLGFNTRRMIGNLGFRVAKAATDATLYSAMIGTKASFSVARGCCSVTGRAFGGAVRTVPGLSRMSGLVDSTHSKVQRMLDVTESCTVTGMKFSGLAMESCLKYLTGKRVLEEGTELSGIVDSVLEFYHLAKAFSLDLRGLGMLELTRALYAIACLQRVFGPLTVPCPVGEEGEHIDDGDVDVVGASDTTTSSASVASSCGDADDLSGVGRGLGVGEEEAEGLLLDPDPDDPQDLCELRGLSGGGSDRMSLEASTSGRSSSRLLSPEAGEQREELHALARYSIASYGRLFLSMWDKAPALLGLSEEEVIARYTDSEASAVLHREEATLFRPAHFVAVDHDLRVVVVAVRGTLGISDTLCDLTCAAAPARLPDGAGGRAHAGFLRAAEALDAQLRPVVDDALARHPGYKLRLCGHSMGAGVAALLAGLWRTTYPALHCYGYGPACVASLGLSRALASHVTAVVLGNDFVSRLSLGTATDLRNAVYSLCKDAEPGLLDRITMEAMAVLRHRRHAAERARSRRPSAHRPVAASAPVDIGDEESTLQQTASLLFLQSVVNALRANMQAEKLVPAGAVYHLHTVGAKTAPQDPLLARSRSASMVCHSPVRPTSPNGGDGTGSGADGPKDFSPPSGISHSQSIPNLRGDSPLGGAEEVAAADAGGDCAGAGGAEPTLGEMRRVNAACFGELMLSRTMLLTHSPHTYERAIKAFCRGLEWKPNILHRLVLRMRRADWA